jgi:hypothetical protein
MSQNLIEADFKKPSPVYLTDCKRYADAMKDEWKAITNDKYQVIKKEVFLVIKK